MISETIEYVNCFFEETKQKHNSVNDVILKSALVYQYLYLKNFKTCISIDDVLELNNNEMDASHTYSKEYSTDPTYYTHTAFYMMLLVDSIPENKTPRWVKKSPLCGQVSALIYCLRNRIII